MTVPHDKESQARLPTGTKLLIVDDNADNAEVMAIYCGIEGYEVKTALSGRRGLEIAKEFMPDVILCDIRLPDMEGFAVARALRADSAFASVVMLAVSGWARAEDREDAIKAGFDAHVAKPVALPALIEMISRLLEARRVQ